MSPPSIVNDYPYIKGLARLHGVEVSECPSCGDTQAEIPSVEQLHQLLAGMIASKREPLNGAEIRFLRKHLGWSGRTFARHFETDSTTVSKWENDKQTMDARAQLLLRVLARSGPLKTEYLLDFSDEELDGFQLSRGPSEWEPFRVMG
ncbi:MAG TPA: hypothetical protein ENK57_20805 [Polyangiaceae bacterium]|nr:hypothetical protein [Polyangiaceae bacterium]